MTAKQAELLTNLRVFNLTHFSATAIMNEVVSAQPLRFIFKTDNEILSIRVRLFSVVRLKPRKSASLQSESSYAILRHFVHTIEACARSLQQKK